MIKRNKLNKYENMHFYDINYISPLLVSLETIVENCKIERKIIASSKCNMYMFVRVFTTHHSDASQSRKLHRYLQTS